MKKNLKILLGLSEISGFYKGLEEGFRQLGIDVTRIDLSEHPYQYTRNEKPLCKIFRVSMARYRKYSSFKGYCWKFIGICAKGVIFLDALLKYDVFVFSYGTTFFRLHDLRILKLLRKKIIFQFHGSDSRPPFMDGAMIAKYSAVDIAKLTAEKKRHIEMINYYADAIIDIPPMGLFHEKPFINWLYIGIPLHIKQKANVKKENEDTLKIVHAPSNPVVKGSAIIEKTILHLQEKGYPIELIRVEGQPNQKVLEALQGCDFVIDQLYADYGMPGFATESAWLGKPVIICGYAKTLWQTLLPPTLLPPTHYCHPHELEGAIVKMCEDVSARLTLGKNAFDYVNTYWSPQEVARRYLAVIQEKAPKEWYCDPFDILYVHGCGIEEQRLKVFLKEFIQSFGIDALQLQNKPLLKKRILEFTDILFPVRF